jgi:PhzF family phenazine biosynthesis protein
MMASMPSFDFRQVDVFAPAALTGNPVAVVHDADPLSDEQMQSFARWTNLSETTFLLAPTEPGADYRLRIFTPGGELPFAGHPTLGSAHAWLERGGTPASAGRLVQQCGIGTVELRRDGDRLAFRAPEFLRSGPVDDATLVAVVATLGILPDQVVASQWIDNGPGWIGVVVGSAEEVLAVRPDFSAMGELKIGIIGAHAGGDPADYEVRAFAPGLAVVEDPVTGSLNAGFAVWLTRAGMAPANYTVRQGTVLGRRGDVHITTDENGDLWVGGASTTLINGTLTI